MAVQGALWLAMRLSLNLNFSFLNRISLLLISSSYPIVLTWLGEPRSRHYTPRKVLGYRRESNRGPLGWQSDVCMYIWGFRARQHLRSLAPVMEDNGWLWWPNDIRGPWEPKASSHLSYRWEKKTRENLIQETCSDRGSNPGPQLDKRACYHLLHSGGPTFT